MVRIENVSCNSFEFSDSENMIESDDEMNLIVTFTSCGFDNFIYSSFFLPSFNKVLFSDKVKIESMSDHNDNSLHFIECIFSDGLSCELVNFKNKNLFIENSKTIKSNEKEKISVTFSCRGGDLNQIDDLTTYIDPQKYIEIFADTDLTSQNFWVQTVIQTTRRGNYSAKQIPFL